MENKSEADLQNKEYGLLFDIRRSVRYHMRRCRFFDLFHSTASAVGVIAGSAAVFTALSGLGKTWTIAAAAMVAIISALDLVVGASSMARLHNDLARKFIQLEKEMTISDELSEKKLRQFISRRLEIEMEEPPVLRCLDCLARNEQLRAEGFPDSEQVHVPWYHRCLAHLISFQPKNTSLQ
jgi:hypothetical protein